MLKNRFPITMRKLNTKHNRYQNSKYNNNDSHTPSYQSVWYCTKYLSDFFRSKFYFITSYIIHINCPIQVDF